MDSPIDAVCEEASSYAFNKLIQVAMVLETLLSLLTIVMTAIFFVRKEHRKVAVHRNLKIVFVSAITICWLYALGIIAGNTRFLFMYLVYQDPCQLAAPLWFVVLCLIPCWLYFAGFPLCHIVGTGERLLATLYSDSYENSRPKYGIAATVVVWFFAIAYVAYRAVLALEDANLSDPVPFFAVSSKTADVVSKKATFFFLSADVGTTIVDFLLIIVNRRKLKNVMQRYSLSSSYQLHENFRVTLRLVFPIGVCNALLFTGFLGVAAVLRSMKDTIAPDAFQAFFEMAALLSLMQAPLSLGIVMYFSKTLKRKVPIVSPSDEARLYFGQFRKQIGTTDNNALNAHRMLLSD